ncbi:serine proteinase stubble isoform X3 [Aedes aegypti]|uniref:Peptidase S1 domain-containing protein n=1 Tax=Aedes aegypti TaxID=7159 RepID=A0A903V1F0_AEDAE|nr:serine proteinase stubble isoform X3 [Aedes aegypti]
MNLRTGAFVGLLCIGLASAQLNYQPEFLSAGQGFRSASQYRTSGIGGSSVTRTQENTGAGISTHTITSGVNLQPFFKKTTVTSHGYDYPVPTTVPCYEPNKVCTPNEYCVNGLVQESQLNLFNTNNQNCNSATEQCCKILPAPPPTQCPDNTYVCVSPDLCNNGLLNFDAQNAISPQPSGQCFSPEVCCKTQSLISESTVLTNEGYVVRVPDNQYLPPEGQNTNTNIQTAPPPRPPTTPRPPPPTTTRYVPPPTTTRYVPPPTTTRYVPPPTTTRYVPPPTTTRYFPPPTTTSPPYRGDEYIPPREEIPASSNTDPNAVRPPQDTNEVPSPAQDTPSFIRPTPPPRPIQPRPNPPPVGGTAPPPLPPVGCSAAMNCTEREFCSSTGVISKTPVVLTPEQELFRVPVTECRNPEKGFTGVCCRDPDYVDPWPVGMLGLYNPEILPFDDGSYKPNGNNGNGVQSGNSISQTQRNEAILASPSRVTAAQNYGPNQITSASQTQYTQSKAQYDRGVTASASTTSTTALQRQQTQTTSSTAGSSGTKRFTAGGLQFVHSGNTRFKPFQKQNGGQCAPRNYNTQPRGAGPWDTGFGEFPWQAMVILESNKTLLCGGAIISETTVVTAANCVYGLNPRDVMIKGGEWRLGVDAEPKTFQIVRVKNVIYHPAYQPTTLNYDVAMLVLEDRLRFDTHIGQLCLDENDVVPSASYENCVTTGWGREVLKVHIGNALMRQMPISLLSEAESQRELQNNGFTPESHICGRPAADACDVDIGSALACADTSGTYYLKGVYSSDNGCGRPDQIVSFSNIDVQWIRQALKNPNQFITPVPNYQTAANSPVASTVQQPSTLGPNYGKAYLPPY